MGILLLVKYKAKASMASQFINDIKEATIDTLIREEDGCISYDYYISTDSADTILLVEKWESKEQQQKHLKAPHMSKLKEIKEAYITDTQVEEYNL